ncbi:hypothetical protein ACU6TU_15640 [Halomonas sp. LS-001]
MTLTYKFLKNALTASGVVTLLLMNTAQAHPGHAPTEVHSHLGSPVMWLMLGVAALGIAAGVFYGRKLWRQSRLTDTKVQRDVK